MSDGQLSEHIQRKHKDTEDTKTTEKQQETNIQQTPVRKLPQKAPQVPNKEQQKILDGIIKKPSPKKNPQARPMTSYVPPKQNEVSNKKSKRPARPQTAKPKDNMTLLERDKFLQNKLKALENIEKSIDNDIMNFKYQNIAKTNQNKQVEGIEVTKEFLLEKSNCDELRQIECLILRDCKIKTFDTHKQTDLNQLVNLE